MHPNRLRPHQSLLNRFAVCAALLCLAGALNAQSENWKTYKYPADGFRASFPSEPKLEQSKKEAKLGSILMNSYCAQVLDTYLCVAMIDQGPEATGLSPEVLLERTKLGVLAAPKTRKLNQQEIDLDGHKGVEIETENDTVHTFTRIYLVDRVLYQTIVTFPVAGQYPNTNRFLDSFKLIARARN